MKVVASFVRNEQGEVTVRMDEDHWLLGSFIETELRGNLDVVSACIAFVEEQGHRSTEVFGGNARGIEANDEIVNVYDLAEDAPDVTLSKGDFLRILREYAAFVRLEPT